MYTLISVPKSLCLGEMRLPVFGLILLMLSACISGWGSTYISLESIVRAAANWIILPLISLLIVCLRLSPKKIFILGCVICVSGFLAVIDSWFSWNEQYPRLNSVGHVNHSALYLSYCLFSMALVILSVPKFNCIKAFILIPLFGSIMMFLSWSDSLVAIAVCMAFLCCFVYVLLKHVSLLVGASIGITAILIIGLLGILSPFKVNNFSDVSSEFYSRITSSDVFSNRDRLMLGAFVMANDSLVGSGLGSFRYVVTPENIKTRLSQNGRDFTNEEELFYFSSHGHSLLSTVLVERGWFGVSSFAVFFISWFLFFLRNLRDNVNALAGLCCLVSIFASSLAQTALHLEHGQLAFVCLSFFSLLACPTTRSSSS